MSALGHKRTHAPQQRKSLFDHLVGDRQHRLRHLDAERPRRLQVDGKLELAALSGYLRAKGRRRQ
jgi:hypothetical protein